MKRVNDTLYDILDSNTGEYFTYGKVTVFADGTVMSDGKCDGVIYRKVGAEYFKRKFTGPVNILWFGAIIDGEDNRPLIQKAIETVGKIGGTLFFPYIGYDYTYIGVLRCLYSNLTFDSEPGVWLNNIVVSAGYPKDGLIIGNGDASLGEGGTNVNPYTYTQNVIVKNLSFRNCRIGVWFVRCKNCSTHNITADGVSAVASGNDATNDCYNIGFYNTRVKSWSLGLEGEPFYIVGVYRTFGFIIDGVFQDVGMPSTPNASAIQIENSENGSFVNVHINQLNANGDAISAGITVTNCKSVFGSNFTVKNCSNGLRTFGNAVVYTMHGFSNGSIENCGNGIAAIASFSTFTNIATRECDNDLLIGGDAYGNTFDGLRLNPNANAVVSEAIAGAANLQSWRNCAIQGSLTGIEGVSNGYVGDNRVYFFARKNAAANAVTGNSIDYDIADYLSKEDVRGDFDLVTGKFTAPVHGTYEFSASVGFANVEASAAVYSTLYLETSAGARYFIGGIQGAYSGQATGGIVIKLTKGETAWIVAQSIDGAQTVNVQPYISQIYFRGRLV